MIRSLTGDCRDILPTLADRSVHCIVTSPPYFGLRDYGTAQWDGGEAECDHRQEANGTRNKGRDRAASNGAFHDSPRIEPTLAMPYRDLCGKCGARRIDAQIGLEDTPDAYVATLVAVFREARRVLRDDGTLWLNLGDSYAANAATANGKRGFESYRGSNTPTLNQEHQGRNAFRGNGIKPKDLLMIPARVALALQADGWYLRSDIIWSKPNPMPESVTDRPTSSHEHVFLLSKRPTYYFDSVAIAERTVDAEAVTEYAAAHETLYDLPNGKGRKPLRKGQIGQRRTEPGLPFLQYEADGRVPSDARRTGEIESIQSSEQRQTEPPSGDARIQPISKSEGCEGSLEFGRRPGEPLWRSIEQRTSGRRLYGDTTTAGRGARPSIAIMRQRRARRLWLGEFTSAAVI